MVGVVGNLRSTPARNNPNFFGQTLQRSGFSACEKVRLALQVSLEKRLEEISEPLPALTPFKSS